MSDEALLRVELQRVIIDWNDDGSDVGDYGWKATLLVRGKHRAMWSSTRGTTRMWPHISRGADENCNRAVTFHCWPIGHLDVWWEPNWRTDEDGECDDCIREEAEFRARRATRFPSDQSTRTTTDQRATGREREQG